MNMAFIGTFWCIIIVTCFSVGKANSGFVNVQCNPVNSGLFGQKSMLECVLTISQEATEVVIRSVTWKKEGVKEPLLVYYRGQTKAEPGYSFAEPSWDNMNINVSLLIANTAVQHEGDYSCAVMTNSGGKPNMTSLKVTAKYSKPAIAAEPEDITQDMDGTLTCRSNGGYPKGQIRWFDVHNKEWTKSAEMEVKQTENGLFDLSSKLPVQRGSSYRCSVFNASGGREDEFTFNIPDRDPTNEGQGGNKPASVSKIVAPLVVIGSLIVGLLVLAVFFYRRRSQQQARRHSAAPLVGDHDRVQTYESDVEEGDHRKNHDTLA